MAYMKDLNGKKALITGGSRGIGLAVACALADRGTEVILLGRDRKRLERARSRLRGKALIFEADVRAPSSLEKVASKLRKKRISIDILVNSAGIVHPVPLMDQTPDEVEETIKTNILGTLNSCKAFIPLMRLGGYISNISSIAGLVGLYGYTSYSASKFGVVGLSEALALELADRGIRVGTVFPPDTYTPQLKEELGRRPEQLTRMAGVARPLSSHKVAAAVVNGIVNGKAMVYPSAMGRLLRLTSGPCGPFIRWYLRRKLHA